ncbi:MAG: 3-oxoacyl-ACP reductase FabG [Proteobacteria bacterium]|nr:3-oxoacyl-ACP reductase FabG [Pseudomonadota bacterium]
MISAKPLSGKIALITGANRGIGLAMARLFASAGATVIMNSRTVGSLDALAAGISAEFGVPVQPSYFDVTSAEAVKAGFMAVHKEHKRLDVLVNNAGILRDALIGMAPEALIDDVIATNIKGVILCSQMAARMMARNKSGSIISLSSIIGRVGNEGQSVYAASKAAVIGFTYSLAKELGPQNIRVNALAPGFIDTDMIKAVPAEKHAKIVGNIKMGRLGKAEDIAQAALFLASDASAYVTGQVLGVDGGMLV